jgi:predicted esterase YcpF (UPF0227 family)
MTQALTPSRKRISILLEKGDETLNWQDAASYYRDTHQVIFQGGNHGFTHFVAVLELIDKF